MKKYFKLLSLILTISFFASCDKKDELIIFDSVNGQEALSFESTSFSVTVPAEPITITIPVNVTTKSSSARTFTTSLDDSSTAIAGSYSIGDVVVPADSFNGSLDVTFNGDLLEDGILYELVLKLVANTNGTVFNEKATVSYNKKVICNDMHLEINTDHWASETTWEIKDSTGAIVQSGGPWADGVATYEFDFYLEDGCYSLTFYDVYEDGMNDGQNPVGTYKLTCSILTLVSEVGSFGASQTTEFCVNPE